MKYLDDVSIEIQNNIIEISNNFQERSFKYDLLDKFENFKKTLTNVVADSGSINVSSTGSIKRSGRLKLSGYDEDIDFINDRVAIYITLSDGETSLDFPVGVYLLSSPTKDFKTKEHIEYDLTFYSKLQILLEDKLNETLVLNINSGYTNAIKSLIESAGLDSSNIENSASIFSRERTFGIGVSKLDIIITLLKEINFESIYTNNNGKVESRLKTKDIDRVIEYNYNRNDKSIIAEGTKELIDIFNVPNSFTIVATNPDSLPIISAFKNYDPDDITSIQSRGREIDYFEEISDISNQSDLDQYLDLVIEREQQIYGNITFKTSLNPLHVYNDCYNFGAKKYVEDSYSYQLSVDGYMTHNARSVENV